MRFLARLCVLLMFGAMCWMGGHWFAVGACNSFLKTEVPSALPDYPTAKYYRYGGSLDDQLDRIKAEGKQELVAEWDRFQTGLWPWDTIKWRDL